MFHSIRPDFIVRRAAKAVPIYSAQFVHGVFWHKKRKRRLHDAEHRNILEASDYHVFELAYGTRPNGSYWVQVEAIVKRIIEGENIRFAGRIEDLLALSMQEGDAVLIS